MQEAFCEVDVSLNHEIMTSFQIHIRHPPKISEPSCVGICFRLLLYADGEHMNVLKLIVHVSYGCRKHFEVAVSLNNEIMTPF
jgi:hypothetical protein